MSLVPESPRSIHVSLQRQEGNKIGGRLAYMYLTCDGVHGMWWRKKSPHGLGMYGRGLRCCTCETSATGLLVVAIDLSQWCFAWWVAGEGAELAGSGCDGYSLDSWRGWLLGLPIGSLEEMAKIAWLYMETPELEEMNKSIFHYH
jgi:hypothetical protein